MDTLQQNDISDQCMRSEVVWQSMAKHFETASYGKHPNDTTPIVDKQALIKPSSQRRLKSRARLMSYRRPEINLND